MNTIPNSQNRAIDFDPYVHTLSMGLEKIHHEAFSSMAYKGHRVSAVVEQTPTKFLVKTECINNEAYSRRHHCRGAGSMQFVLGENGPMLFLAELNHDEACNHPTATLEDGSCKDKTFCTKYCDYLSEAVEFSSTNAKAKRDARKSAEAKGYDVPDTDITSMNAGNLNKQIMALCQQIVDHYSVPQPKSFWKS